MAGKEPG
jgi:hypothetical protein